ncbi:MAG: TetR/AcrR family transcriptional regulator [Myxococcales bacterium]|nr:TetR/AcrR family transcriptional regulator [Myxococcales bacterium]MDD9968010.1 TetR/AcrR family transcriptional regulator [Myxococcales bacterium]
MTAESTPSDTLRARNIAGRRKRILDSTRRILANEGMGALTMRRLADESGLAVKTLYNLYGGRESILEAVVTRAMDMLDEALANQGPWDDPLERCVASITMSVDYLVRERAFRALVLARYQKPAKERASDDTVVTRGTQIHAEAIREAIARGMLRDALGADHLGRQIYAGYQHAQAQWAFGMIDAEEFLARALYGLYVTLLAVASDATHPLLEAKARKLERILP